MSVKKSKKDVEVDVPQPQSQGGLFEEVLDLLGGFGRFQFLILVLFLTLEIPVAFVTFIPIFVGGNVLPTEWNCGRAKISTEEEICSCNKTLHSDSFNSIVSEWSLICDKEWVSDFITTIQMLGMFFGNIFGSQFADWYGRKAGFLWTTLLLTLGSAVSAVAPNPYIYAVSRFICGAGIPAFINITCMAVIEFMPPKWRSLSNSVGPTGEGIMLLSVLAYFIRPWRTLYWVTLAPFTLIIFIYPFVPESPRWLLRNGRVEEAEKVLKYIARINNSTPVGIEVLQKISENEQTTSKALGSQRFTYLDFFRDKSLRTTSLYMMAIWFSWAFTYFGIGFNIKNLKGNIYLNVFLLGLSNALGQRAAMLINDKLGRRKSLFLSMTLSAVSLVALAFGEIFLKDEDTLYQMVVTCCFIATFGMGSARSSARLLSGESFPTPVRTMGLGLGGVASNIAGTMTPQLAYIGSQWPSIPFFTFAFVGLAGSLVSFRMTETQGQPLSN